MDNNTTGLHFTPFGQPPILFRISIKSHGYLPDVDVSLGRMKVIVVNPTEANFTLAKYSGFRSSQPAPLITQEKENF